ncbi:MAG TPA: hypothetical protein VFO98_16050 [Marmoricola sp.]|nr:hypothetical protein [Marmoricola sp.]
MHLSPAVLLSIWFDALRAGSERVEGLVERVRGEAPNTIVVSGSGTVQSLGEVVADWAASGARMRLALPVPGDPVGLGGPAGFNQAALDAGEAVVVAGAGLVPGEDARTLVWHSHPAEPAPYVDARESARGLRMALLETTRTLVGLDVASWQPEIPDLLMNLRHRPRPMLPQHWDGARAETLDRALLCREVVALALEDQGGAVSAYEMGVRRDALRDLDRAARRALVAVCSDSLVSP